MKHGALLGPLVALIALAPAATAQEKADVAYHHQFTYIGTSLTVEVLSPEAGELHIVRGEPGQLRVRGATAGGFAGAGLVDEDDHLRITVVGADRARFLVVVPEEVFVRIKIPGEPVAQTLGAERAEAVLTWGAEAAAGARTVPPGPAPRRR